jgi:hypothetical protein
VSVPADDEQANRRADAIAVSAVLAHTLIEINPPYPTVSDDARERLKAAKAQLEAQAPAVEPADPVQESAARA